jgi:hypothetical protein
MTPTVTCICGCDLLGARPTATCGRRSCAFALRANDLAVARASDTTHEALAALATHRSLLVRAAVARNPATPTAALARLASDDVRVVRELAANPSVDALTLRHLLRHPSVTVRRALASNLALPEDAYLRLGALHPRQLARNPAWLEHVDNRPSHPAYYPGSVLVWRLLMARVAPPALVARLLTTGTARERTLLASQPGASLEAIAALHPENDGVRRTIARNPACPEALLRKLAAEGDERLRVAVAFNPTAPRDLVREVFAGDRAHVLAWWPQRSLRGDAVMQALARDPRCPLAVREELLALGNRAIRILLAANPATPGSMLRELARTTDHDLLFRVASHPRTPADVLGRIADVEVGLLRTAVARHPATPRDILQRLAHTKHWSTKVAGPIARERLYAYEAREARSRARGLSPDLPQRP